MYALTNSYEQSIQDLNKIFNTGLVNGKKVDKMAANISWTYLFRQKSFNSLPPFTYSGNQEDAESYLYDARVNLLEYMTLIGWGEKAKISRDSYDATFLVEFVKESTRQLGDLRELQDMIKNKQINGHPLNATALEKAAHYTNMKFEFIRSKDKNPEKLIQAKQEIISHLKTLESNTVSIKIEDDCDVIEYLKNTAF